MTYVFGEEHLSENYAIESQLEVPKWSLKMSKIILEVEVWFITYWMLSLLYL